MVPILSCCQCRPAPTISHHLWSDYGWEGTTKTHPMAMFPPHYQEYIRNIEVFGVSDSKCCGIRVSQHATGGTVFLRSDSDFVGKTAEPKAPPPPRPCLRPPPRPGPSLEADGELPIMIGQGPPFLNATSTLEGNLAIEGHWPSIRGRWGLLNPEVEGPAKQLSVTQPQPFFEPQDPP